MVDIVIPRALAHSRNSFRYIDQTGVSRGIYTGAAQSTGYGGDRVGATIAFTQHGGGSSTARRHRAQLQAFLMSLRGKQNRVYVSDEAYTPAGTLAAAELFTNGDFSSGTSGWTADQGGALTTSDGVARLTVSGVGSNPEFYRLATVAAYKPYALRTLYRDGFQSSALSAGPSLTLSGSASVSSYSVGGGYKIASGVALASGSFNCFPLVVLSSTGYNAGAFASVLFTSLAQCALLDAGGNLFTKSDELDHADWSKSELTVTANAATDPYGTNTADLLVPSTNAATHFELQTKTVSGDVADFMVCGYFRRSGYNFIRLQLNEHTASTVAYQLFNLSSGALGAATSTGANWSNLRASIVDMGGDWFYCSLIARKTNAATSISGLLIVANADSAAGFAGDGTSGVYGSRATMFPSSSFAQPILTTTAAAAASTPSGSGFWLKGLDASQTGYYLAGNWIEIDGQLKMLETDVNTDAAGRGYMQLAPSVRRALSDNTPIIVHRPMGRFLYAGDNVGWDNEPGVYSSASIDLEEAFT